MASRLSVGHAALAAATGEGVLECRHPDLVLHDQHVEGMSSCTMPTGQKGGGDKAAEERMRMHGLQKAPSVAPAVIARGPLSLLKRSDITERLNTIADQLRDDIYWASSVLPR